MPIEDILSSRDFSNLLSLFDHDKNGIVVQAMDAVIKILDCGGDVTKSGSSPLQDDFRDAGGVLLTVGTLMARAEMDPLIKLRGMNILRICARNKDNCNAIMEEEAIFILLQYFQDFETPAVQESTAACLVNLCAISTIRDTIFQLGCFDLMMTVLQQSISKAVTTNQPFPKLVSLILSMIGYFTDTEIAYQHELLILPGSIELLIECLRGITDAKAMGEIVTIISSILQMNSNQQVQTMKSLYPSVWSFPKKFHEAGGIQVCKTILQSETISAELKYNILILLNQAQEILHREIMDNNIVGVLIEIGMSNLDSEDSFMDTLRQQCFHLSAMFIQTQCEEDQSIVICRMVDQTNLIQQLIRRLKDSYQHKKLYCFLHEIMFIFSRLTHNNVNLCKTAARENVLSVLANVLYHISSTIPDNGTINDTPIEEIQINILFSLASTVTLINGLSVSKECNLIPQLVVFCSSSTLSSSLKELSLQILSSLASVDQNKPLIQESSFVEDTLFQLENWNTIEGLGVSKTLYLMVLYNFLFRSSDLCRIDIFDRTIIESTNESRLLKVLYDCIETKLQPNLRDEEMNESCLIGLKIIKSLSVITRLKAPMFQEQDLLQYLVPLLDIRNQYGNPQYETELRKLSTSILLNYCGPHLDDEDAALFAKYNIAQHINNLQSFEIDKDIIFNLKDIQKWIAYMLEMVAFRKHCRLLQGSQWIAPFECTLYRCKIPFELRYIIKQYLFKPLTNNNIRKIALNWQIHDPMITYKEYGHISEWDTSQVTVMDYVFSCMYNHTYRDDMFNEDIENWNVSNVTSMIGMFQNSRKFNKPLNMWKVDNVVNMSIMFNDAIMFNQPLDSWNVNKVKNFYGMFNGAIEFNQSRSKFGESVCEEEVKSATEETG